MTIFFRPNIVVIKDGHRVPIDEVGVVLPDNFTNAHMVDFPISLSENKNCVYVSKRNHDVTGLKQPFLHITRKGLHVINMHRIASNLQWDRYEYLLYTTGPQGCFPSINPE
jgi:hypothetical protein